MKRIWKQILIVIFNYLFVFIGAYCFFQRLGSRIGDISIKKNIIGAFLIVVVAIIIRKYAENEINK